VRYRENVMLLMVFVSIPLLFLSGASWPQSAIPGFWQGISWLFPSTFGVRAYIRLNTMGGSIGDVLTEYQILWIQVFVYFLIAYMVYRRQIQLACQHAGEPVENKE
jgi:ABC-2 type transport system permease protein